MLGLLFGLCAAASSAGASPPEAAARPDVPTLPQMVRRIETVRREADEKIAEITEVSEGLQDLAEFYLQTGKLGARGRRERLRESHKRIHHELTLLFDDYRDLKSQYYALQMMKAAAGINSPLETQSGISELAGSFTYEEFDRKLTHARRWSSETFSFEEETYGRLLHERDQKRRLIAIAAVSSGAILAGGIYLWRRRSPRAA